MTPLNPRPPETPARETPPAGAPPQQAPQRPWRTEGLPKSDPPKPRRRWTRMAIWFVAYLVLFALLTLQDRLAGPQSVPYTEFKKQVASKNVDRLFARGDSIEGQLKTAAPLPGQTNQTYQQFRTERPTFASDDLLSELTPEALRCARRHWFSIADLSRICSSRSAPILLLVAFYVWMFRRQQSGHGRAVASRQAEASRSRHGSSHVC